jgi:hypothetical protein
MQRAGGVRENGTLEEVIKLAPKEEQNAGFKRPSAPISIDEEPRITKPSRSIAT